ncbi:MAG TPA: hypothetical protein VF432_19215 [Thermoanaerobaculia bacterium]
MHGHLVNILARRSFVVPILAMCFGAPLLHACTCVTVPLKRAFMASDVVFAGTVVDERGFLRTDHNVPRGVQRQFFVPAVVTIRVDRRFLGSASDVQEVTLDSCGALPKGDFVLVFASRHADTVQNRGCLSMSLKKAEPAIRQLQRRAWFWRAQRRFRAWWSRLAKGVDR